MAATDRLRGGMDPAKAAGLLVVAAVVGLALLRRGFAGVNVTVGS